MSLFNQKELRRYQTLSERRLWDRLRSRQVAGQRFRRQHPIGRTIVDFICIRKGLIVELDGEIHNKRKEYDQRRDAWLTSLGYRVIRFKNEQVEKELDKIVEIIRNELTQ